MALSKYNNYNGALWSFLYYMYQLTTPIIRTYPMFTTVDMLGSSVGLGTCGTALRFSPGDKMGSSVVQPWGHDGQICGSDQGTCWVVLWFSPGNMLGSSVVQPWGHAGQFCRSSLGTITSQLLVSTLFQNKAEIIIISLKVTCSHDHHMTYLNQRLPGACNRSPGSKLLSITMQLHCGGHLGGRA